MSDVIGTVAYLDITAAKRSSSVETGKLYGSRNPDCSCFRIPTTPLMIMSTELCHHSTHHQSIEISKAQVAFNHRGFCRVVTPKARFSKSNPNQSEDGILTALATILLHTESPHPQMA